MNTHLNKWDQRIDCETQTGGPHHPRVGVRCTFQGCGTGLSVSRDVGSRTPPIGRPSEPCVFACSKRAAPNNAPNPASTTPQQACAKVGIGPIWYIFLLANPVRLAVTYADLVGLQPVVHFLQPLSMILRYSLNERSPLDGIAAARSQACGESKSHSFPISLSRNRLPTLKHGNGTNQTHPAVRIA